jgi:drug/metabolite transporter (DMT)-like permease
MQIKVVFIALIALFILYRIYLRLRRNVGWQWLNSRRLQVSTAVLTLLGITMVALGASRTSSLISDAAGIVIGLILAYYGSATTRFNQREKRLYYLPNTWIGAIVTALFFGRILYRIYDAATLSRVHSTGEAQVIFGGWSAGLMLVMVSYYVAYNLFLLRKQRQLLAGDQI